MIIYLWDAPPRCGVSGSLEKAQEAAGTTLMAGHAPSARVESARLTFSAALEPAYARTGRVWQARSPEDGVITWEPGDAGLGPQPGAPFRVPRLAAASPALPPVLHPDQYLQPATALGTVSSYGPPSRSSGTGHRREPWLRQGNRRRAW